MWVTSNYSRELGPCVGPMEGAAGTRGGKRNHEEISHMMALVEAARKVRATTARPCAQGQTGSQRGSLSRHFPPFQPALYLALYLLSPSLWRETR